MDHDKEFQGTSRDSKEDEEQGRRHHGTNMSIYQVDPKFQTHMTRHAHTEMKMQDHQDDDKESVPINQEMDHQPSRGKRKCDDEEDDQKPAAKPKKDIPEDDEENQDNDDQETVKKEYINEMFQRYFKSTLGPQDDNEEPHPTITHMYTVKIIETMNVLQAMLHYLEQLLNLYHAKTHQETHYLPISEQKWSK